MVDKILENWSKAQKAGAWLPCPRCGLLAMKPELHTNAYSRVADIYICDSCGLEEAFESHPFGGKEPKKLENWFVVRNVYRHQSVVQIGKKFEVIAEHPIMLSVMDIDDIMASALNSGISYWADAADVDEEHRVADWGHEQIARGGFLRIHDTEENKWHELTLEKFLNGFKLWVEQGRDWYGAVQGKKVDCCNIDGVCADSIVQLALFGEVIYG